MENASKALIMAGGILVGMIILSIFVYEMIFVSSQGHEYEEKMARAQVASFNAKFEPYFGRELTPQEFVTLFNFVEEWNNNHESEIDRITMNCGTYRHDILTNGQEGFLAYYNTPPARKDNGESKYFFRCSNIIYNQDRDGRLTEFTVTRGEYI